jgi:phage shock protein A
LDRLAFESLGAVNQRELHIADLDAQLESERAVSAALRGQISDLTGEIANLREQLANAKNELDEMQASTSWRVSAPVRLIGGVTRRRR